LTGFKGFLNVALDLLGFNNAPNPDGLVNMWLYQTVSDGSEDANQFAVNIISKLITDIQNAL